EPNIRPLAVYILGNSGNTPRLLGQGPPEVVPHDTSQPVMNEPEFGRDFQVTSAVVSLVGIAFIVGALGVEQTGLVTTTATLLSCCVRMAMCRPTGTQADQHLAKFASSAGSVVVRGVDITN